MSPQRLEPCGEGQQQRAAQQLPGDVRWHLSQCPSGLSKLKLEKQFAMQNSDAQTQGTLTLTTHFNLIQIHRDPTISLHFTHLNLPSL